MYFCVVRESLSMVDVVFCAASLLSTDVVDDDFFCSKKLYCIVYNVYTSIYMCMHILNTRSEYSLSLSLRK